MCVQLVWLVRELVKSGMMGADGVVMTLLKQIAGQTPYGHTGLMVCVRPHAAAKLTCLCSVCEQEATSPRRTCGWPRASWTSCWTRSLFALHSVS